MTTLTNGSREVRIAPNDYAGDRTFIAVLYIAGSALRSRTFKTEAGAQRWGAKQIGGAS